MLGFSRPLPDPLIWLRPPFRGVVDQRHQKPPIIVVGRMTAAMPAPRQVHQLAIRVELPLLGGVVADPYRPGAAVALQALRVSLAEPALAADAVDNLELLRM